MKATLKRKGRYFYPIIEVDNGVTITFNDGFVFACSALNFAKNYITQIKGK